MFFYFILIFEYFQNTDFVFKFKNDLKIIFILYFKTEQIEQIFCSHFRFLCFTLPHCKGIWIQIYGSHSLGPVSESPKCFPHTKVKIKITLTICHNSQNCEMGERERERERGSKEFKEVESGAFIMNYGHMVMNGCEYWG